MKLQNDIIPHAILRQAQDDMKVRQKPNTVNVMVSLVNANVILVNVNVISVNVMVSLSNHDMKKNS